MIPSRSRPPPANPIPSLPNLMFNFLINFANLTFYQKQSVDSPNICNKVQSWVILFPKWIYLLIRGYSLFKFCRYLCLFACGFYLLVRGSFGQGFCWDLVFAVYFYWDRIVSIECRRDGSVSPGSDNERFTSNIIFPILWRFWFCRLGQLVVCQMSLSIYYWNLIKKNFIITQKGWSHMPINLIHMCKYFSLFSR